MKSITALLLLGLTAAVNAAAAPKCARDNCLRGIIGKKFTKECQEYLGAATGAASVVTVTKEVIEQKVVTVTPTNTVLCTTTLGDPKTIIVTVSSTKIVAPTSGAASVTSAAVVSKRAEKLIPATVSKLCAGNVASRYASACSCALAELMTGSAPAGKAATPQTTTVTNKVTKYSTTTLPVPTSTITVTPVVTKTLLEIKEATQTPAAEKTFKIRLKGGMHDGRYLFPGPIFDEQPGIYYSMFTPNRGDSIDFKINKDGVISTTTGGLNLTYSTDFDDDMLYPAEEGAPPTIKVPSFVFLMAEATQAIPDYNASPIICTLSGDNLSCTAGEKRTESGWYAFGIDETNYIPTLGLGKPGYDWMYWPGQKSGLVVEWN
ncbi:hypothetical protein TWF718_002818 [Orbilia javanica]|uniref:Uncharacterized protein n=1 Tax=Orbilia javanica TaxID=47235 RepID=A0AAN8MNX8_9PEZI